QEGYIDGSGMQVGGGADNVVVPNQKVAQNVLIDGAFDPQSRIQNMCLTYQARASRRESRRMLAIRTHASALAMDASKSLASRRLRPNQAKLRSTTQRRGSGLNVPKLWERVTISIVHWPRSASASSSFGPR